MEGSDDALLGATLADDMAEPPIDDTDGAVGRLVDEMERQRVYDARPWTPPGQYQLKLAIDQVVADMSGLVALARSASTEEVSRSLAVFDETFSELLDGVRRGDRQVGQVVVGSSIAVSAGIVAWLLRGGALAASLFSVLPAWMTFDPVPILVGRRDLRAPTPPTPDDDSSETAVARVLRPGTRHEPNVQLVSDAAALFSPLVTSAVLSASRSLVVRVRIEDHARCAIGGADPSQAYGRNADRAAELARNAR
jgi:hypothetical protein